MSEQQHTLQIRRGLALAEEFGLPHQTVADLTIRPTEEDIAGQQEVVGQAECVGHHWDWVVSSHGGVIHSVYSAEGRCLMWVQVLADGSWTLHMMPGVWGQEHTKLIMDVMLEFVAGLPSEED